MKKTNALICLTSILCAVSAFADTQDPVLKLKDGRVITLSNVSNRDGYDAANPFVLVGACYEGSSQRLVKEILLNEDFLDHYGDYSCDTEASLSKDNRVIKYKCSDLGGEEGAILDKSFAIVPCSTK